MPWIDDTTFALRGQKFEIIGVEPYTRANGKASALATWRGGCAKCGAVFTFQASAKGEFLEGRAPRRCEVHRGPTRIRSVHPSAAVAVPSAPAPDSGLFE